MGLSLILLVVSVAGIILYANMTQVKSNINEVVNVKQPLLNLLTHLNTTLKDSSGAMALYLLSKDKHHRENYLAKIAELKKTIDLILISVNEDSSYFEKIKDIEQQIELYSSFQDQMLELATNHNKNFPALNYAAKEMSPHGQTILQNLSQMLLSEEDEELRRRYRAAVEHRIAREWLLDALSAQEKIEVPSEELQEEMTRLGNAKGRTGSEYRSLSATERKQRVRDALLERKIFDFLIDASKVEEEKVIEGQAPVPS